MSLATKRAAFVTLRPRYDALMDALTWKQYIALPVGTTYIVKLEAARHVTNSRKLHAIIDELIRDFKLEDF